jgi:glycosyltransferase involved in cell wall biosynthesis
MSRVNGASTGHRETAVNLGMSRIDRPYLLVSPIPHYLHADGSIWLDRLWRHDLVAHLTYLGKFTLLSPRLPWRAEDNLVRFHPPENVDFRIIPIPPLQSLMEALWRLPQVALILWKAVGQADIVHSGIGGWPVSLGWVANPIALLRRKKLLIVVESAFWRVAKHQRASWKARLRGAVTEFLGRFFVNRAHLLLFTQPSYRTSLLTRGRGQAHVFPATWIDEDNVLSARESDRIWDEKQREAARELRMLFAGRLVHDKGIGVLLAAVRTLDRESLSLRVDVIGDGPQRGDCEATAQSLKSVKMSLLPPVPYGSPFFELLRRYHAVIVPSLSDEQPRVIFDAFSQAVPVLASRTDGLAPYVVDGCTGRLFEPGDADSLAAVLREAAGDVTRLRRQGVNGLDVARKSTHREMHRTRSRIIVDCFGPS